MIQLNSEQGAVTISNAVFSNITGIAATNCFGVKGMAYRSMTDGLVHLLRREAMSKGVSITSNDDGTISVELHIIVENGVNLPAVCSSIMNEVRYMVTKNTGVEVRAVDVCVDSMPLPKRIDSAELPYVGNVPAVVFDGITHCIVPAGAITREAAEAAVRPLCAALEADACGILLYDEPAAAFAPLVYVRSTETAVWESGCGSGTAAVGAYLAFRANASKTVSLRQPGGTITVSAEWINSSISALTITGHVWFPI